MTTALSKIRGQCKSRMEAKKKKKKKDAAKKQNNNKKEEFFLDCHGMDPKIYLVSSMRAINHLMNHSKKSEESLKHS